MQTAEQAFEVRGRGGRRLIVVIHLTCGNDTILVRSEVGDRDAWQLPGGRADWARAPLAQALEITKRETGIALKTHNLVFVRIVKRDHGLHRQIICLYRVTLTPREAGMLCDPSPDGHRTDLVPSASLTEILSEGDRELLGLP